MHAASFITRSGDHRRAATACLAATFVAVAGCDSRPFVYTPISGQITYEDGEPVPVDGGLRLTFYSDAPPVDGKVYPRPGSAMPDKEGKFTPMTMRPGDGLVKGTHRVTVSYMGRDATGRIPKAYTLKDQTPLIVDTEVRPFDIKIPRP